MRKDDDDEEDLQPMPYKLQLHRGAVVLFALFILGSGLAAAQAQPTAPTATDCSLSLP